MVKNPLTNTGDSSSVPGSGRSRGEGHGNPFQHYCLETSMVREPGRLQSMGSERVRHNLAHMHAHKCIICGFVIGYRKIKHVNKFKLTHSIEKHMTFA